MASGTFYPAASGDDAYAKGVNMYIPQDSFILGKGSSAPGYKSFVRFTNVTIPQGATINSATIRCTAYLTRDGTVCNVTIRGNDADNPSAPGDATAFDALDLTTASVAWSGIAAWTDGDINDSPDIKTVIQEIVDRGGFASGNAVIIVFLDNGSDTNALRNVSSFDFDSGSEKAELHVDWTEAAAGWANKAAGVSSPASVNGVAAASIASVNGVS